MSPSSVLCIVFLVLVQTLNGFVLNCVNSKQRTIKTTRPIIGVMAQSSRGEPYHNTWKSYIAASYIKYLESSGARVVPIKNNLADDEVEKLFYSINGFLLPGGGANLLKSGYQRIGRIIFNLAIESFEKGDYFPIWGTCLGFQYLSILASNNVNILSGTDSENYPIPLNFTDGYENSRMFANMSKDLEKYLSSAPTTLNMHHGSVLTEKFKANKEISEFFHVLSTNNDRQGKEFVSTMEGRKYPFYATQWHPEKNSFEWSLHEDIPHEPMAIKVTQYMSNFFVNEARYSTHKFESEKEERAALIYNYNPIFTGNVSNFEQCYVFN